MSESNGNGCLNRENEGERERISEREREKPESKKERGKCYLFPPAVQWD